MEVSLRIVVAAVILVAALIIILTFSGSLAGNAGTAVSTFFESLQKLVQAK